MKLYDQSSVYLLDPPRNILMKTKLLLKTFEQTISETDDWPVKEPRKAMKRKAEADPD